MKKLSYPAVALIFAAFAVPAYARPLGAVSHLHGINPSLSLSQPATGPVQQQMQDDYATQLMQAQRELLQQNPSGLGRQEIAIGHQLDGYTPR